MDPDHPKVKPPPPRRLARAGIGLVAIFFVTVLVFFLGRTFWHAAEQEVDPASNTAPERVERTDPDAPSPP